MTQQSFTTQLQEQADYTKPGTTRKSEGEDEQVQFSLVCLTKGTEIPEHVASRNVSLTVIEGRGVLTLEGREITLQPGVFVYMQSKNPPCAPCIGKSRISAYLKLKESKSTTNSGNQFKRCSRYQRSYVSKRQPGVKIAVMFGQRSSITTRCRGRYRSQMGS